MSAGDWKEFYRAADEGNFELVKLHISRGVNPNYQHPEIQMTALVTAIENGHSEIAVYLLENGARADLESYFHQRTPLQSALKKRDLRVLQALSARGVRPAWWKRLFL
ncbi:MAG: ankyrin repeat domain-containing protein [Bdellovibrionaceae bacterium]|nr:ankyrin repeat domain-containing protein [Pseudobdellovibrionaceae bacterium]